MTVHQGPAFGTHRQEACDHERTTVACGGFFRCTECGMVWVIGVTPPAHIRIVAKDASA